MPKILLLLVLLVSCSPDSPPDKRATVRVVTAENMEDTIIIEYFRDLRLSGGDQPILLDGNHNYKSGPIKYFSIVGEVKLLNK